jgi:hypothetical protein
MWKRVGVLQPARRCEHRYLSTVQRSCDVLWRCDQRACRQTRCDEVRHLVHGQYRHPVGGVVRKPEPSIDITHRVGERSAARHDEQSTRSCRRCDRVEHAIEVSAVQQEAATQFHDSIDHHR